MKQLFVFSVIAGVLAGCEMGNLSTGVSPPLTYDNPLDAIGELTEEENARLNEYIEKILQQEQRRKREKGCWFEKQVRTCEI